MKPLHFIARLRTTKFTQFLGILLITVTASLDAATITVTNNTDDVISPGVGSLRSAISAAADGDTIDFDPAITGTISLAGAELVLDKNLTITGPGATNLAVSANQLSRVFSVAAGKTVAISGLTVRDGAAASGVADGVVSARVGQHGGAILNEGNLTLTDCKITASNAGHGGSVSDASGTNASGGAGGSGGGIFSNGGSVSLVRCIVSGNRGGNGGGWTLNATNASGQGGAGGDGGGIAVVGGALTVQDSTFSANFGGNGGVGLKRSASQGPGGGSGGDGGAVQVTGGNASIARSTFEANGGGTGGTGYTWPGSGGYGGALLCLDSSVTLNSCTVSGNTAGLGGLLQRADPYTSAGFGGGITGMGTSTITLTSCTIANNSLSVPTPWFEMAYRSGLGGGIAILPPAILSMRNSIVAGNVLPPTFQPGVSPDIYGAVTSAGHNLIGKIDGSTGIVAGTNGDLAGTIALPLNPLLAPPGANGGPTATVALLPGSPAIDAGDDTLSGTDQRGLPRLVGSHVDIGAVEVDASSFSVISFATSSSSLGESDGSITVTVNRSGNMSASVSVAFATSGISATSGSDFTATSGTLNFAAGESQKTISVPIIDDSSYEDDETFLITLSSPSGAFLGTTTTHTVTIATNDDSGAILFAVATTTVSETAGNILVTITRSATLGSVGVSYATAGGTATSGSDFSATSGSVTFADGVAQQTISVPILNDSAFESDEEFSIVLSAPTNGARLDVPSKTTHQVIIQSEDPAPPVPQISFFAGSSSVEESAGSALISVRRSTLLSSAVSVSYATAPGTATSGSDYTESSGVLNFAAFETERFIAIPISADAVTEESEAFTVTLSSPTGGAVLGANRSHSVTILGAPTLALANIEVSTSENAGNVLLSVVRAGSTATSVSVQYSTTPGTATAGADYTATSGTLTFEAGISSRTITVPILRDSIADDGETFTVNLSAPSGAVVSAASSEITITDVVPARNASFHGLAQRRSGDRLGGISLNTTSKNRLTGKLRLDGEVYSFNGLLGDGEALTKTYALKVAKARVQRTLALRRSNDGLTVEGTFTLEDGTIYDLVADADATTEQAAGSYNAVLSSEAPALRGFTRTVVKSSGAVSVKGCLPDGTDFTHSTHIAANGNIALFIPLYARDRGYLGGTANIANEEISATVSWEKPPTRRGAYRDGFDDQSLELSGALYAFTSGTRVLNDFDATNGNGNAYFSEGGLASDLTIPITYPPTNRITLGQDGTITVVPATGLFKGTFKDSSGVRHSIKGIVIPGVEDTDIAEGYFTSGATTGIVRISAE